MPSKIWLPNVEEIGRPLMANDTRNYNSAVQKYLWLLEEGDLFILPCGVSPDFLDYLIKIKGLKTRPEILVPEKSYPGQPFMESLLQDRVIIQKLQKIGQEKSHHGVVLCPYIATLSTLTLSKVTAIPLVNTYQDQRYLSFIESNGVMNFNCKSHIKKECQLLGIPFIAGESASSVKELEVTLLKMMTESNLLIIKKAYAGGGLGNFMLPANGLTLHERLQVALGWYIEQCYQDEIVVVEPYLNFLQIVGSLSVISKEFQQYHGIDLQIIRNNGWSGVLLPFRNRWEEEIKRSTLILGEKIRALGGRGLLNLDFGITENGPVLIESNFRLNGFYLIEQLRELLQQNSSSDNIHILFDSAWRPTDATKHLIANEAPQKEKEGAIRFDQESYLLWASTPSRLEELRRGLI